MKTPRVICMTRGVLFWNAVEATATPAPQSTALCAFAETADFSSPAL